VFRKNLLSLIHSYTLKNKTEILTKPLVYLQPNACRHIQKKNDHFLVTHMKRSLLDQVSSLGLQFRNEVKITWAHFLQQIRQCERPISPYDAKHGCSLPSFDPVWYYVI